MAEPGDTPLGAFLESLERLAEAQRRAAEALTEGDAPAADAAWAALEAGLDRWRETARQAAAGAESAPGADTLARFLDPGQWLFSGCDTLDPALRRLIAGPDPRELAEFGREGLPATREWRTLRRALAAHRALVAKAWAEAFAEVSAAAAADPPLDPIAAHRRWTDAAERALDALHRSDAFAASQARVVAAAVALREVETALVEAWCEARGLPTRREVDDLHRAVAELAREVRALRREREPR